MKRQANALTAVLENWEDVENAIDIYANSAGSSLRENEIYLDSWEAKSKAVSSAWNEFVNTFLNSDWIKGFLEGSQEVLSFLTDINGAIPILAGLISGVLVSAILKGTITVEGFNAALIKANILSGGIPLLIGALTTGAGVLISMAISASDTAKQIEKLTTKIEEQQKAIDDLNAKEKEAADLYKEYASLMSKSNAYGLTAEEKENLLQISNDLVDTYGLEVQGIDAVTGAYILGTDAINDYVEALRAERLEKQKEQQKTRDKRIKKNLNIASDYISPSDIDDYLENAKKYYKMVQKPYEKWDDSFIQEFQQSTRGIDGLDEAMQEYLDGGDISKFETSLYQSAGKYTSAINSVIKDIVTNVQVDTANILNANGESFLTQLLTPYLTNVDWEKFDHKDFEDKVEKFVSEISGTILDVSERINKRQSEISAGTLKFSGYEDMYSALKGQASILNEMLNQGIIDEKSYKEQITQLSQQIANNIGLSMVEISNKFDETDVKSKEAFEAIANNFIDLENQFKQGTISSTQYLDSLTTTISQMDFTEVFGNNKDAAQQFFTTLTSKTSNILQDTITQFEAGKISVTEYGDRLSDFAQQQKELAKNAVDEAVALGIEGKELEQIKSKYAETEEAIDSAIKKWEELRNINNYLDDNVEVLRNATSTISEGYQGFVDGLYSEFTKLSDETRENVISNMQSMEGYASISADNLLSTMQSNVGATEALANAVASETNGTLNNVVNNGGKVLSALGNAIKKFNFSITFDPNAKFSGGEFDLVKWVKSGGKKGIKLPSLTWQIKGSGGKSLQNLGTSLSNLGNSLSTYSNNIDISDYFGGNGSGLGSSGSTVNKNGSGGSSKETKETFDWIETAISRLQRTITNFGKTVSATWKSWTDRNSALKSQISAVTQEINLQSNAANKYLSLANSVGLGEGYKSLVRNGTLDISTITDENTIDAIKQYQEYYENYLSALDAKQDAEDELANLAQTQFNNVAKQYDDRLSVIEHETNLLNGTIDILENKGYLASAKLYDSLIQNEQERLSELQAKYTSLNSAISGISQGTEQWYEMYAEVLSVKEEIQDATNAMIEFNNSVRDLEWEVFDVLQERMSTVISEAEFFIELISDEKMFDDNGITEHGQATLGLHAVNYNVYMQKADEYKKALEELDEAYANDSLNQDYLERRDELLEQHRDMILSAESEKEALKDLMSQGYDSLLESMQKIIDKKKEMMSQITDLFDYEKSIKNLTTEISSLEKQRIALGGDTSEESLAKRQQLDVAISEARENLEETEREQFIKDMERIYELLQEETEMFISERLDNEDLLLQNIIDSINGDSGSIKATLQAEAKEVGTTISDKMESIFSPNGTFTSVVSTYSGQFTNKLTTVNDTLTQIKNLVDHMVKDADAEAAKQQAQSSTPATSTPSTSGGGSSSSSSSSGGSSSSSKSGWEQYLIYKADSYPKSKLNVNGSIVDKMKYNNFDSSFNARAKLYSAMGGSGSYVGSSSQNVFMLNKMKSAGYKVGSSNIPYNQSNWIHKDELVYRASDGGLLMPLGSGDKVFTKEMSDKLWNMAQIDWKPTLPRYDFSNLSTRGIGDSNIGDITFDIKMYGVNDIHEMAEQVKTVYQNNVGNLRKTIKADIYGGMMGKNSLNRYKY